MRYLLVFLRPPSLLCNVHRTQRRDWLLGLDLVTTSVMRCAICTGSLYNIASLTSSAYLCILFTTIGRHPTWSTVSPPQPVSVTVDDFGPQVANATSSRERDSNLSSAASPLLARQLGTAFHHSSVQELTDTTAFKHQLKNVLFQRCYSSSPSFNYM